MEFSFRSYMLSTALVIAAIIGGAWLFTKTMRMYFMESGYPSRVAKEELLSRCDLGSVLILGDSRPEASIIPRRMPTLTTNLAFGGATPVETYFTAQHALRCADRPKLIVYSHSITGFAGVNEGLWKSAVRFGLLSYHDLREIETTASTLGDPSVAATNTKDGLSGTIRDLVYASGSPTTFMASVIAGRAFERYGKNIAIYDSTFASRGQIGYDHALDNIRVGVDAETKMFIPAQTEDSYFDKTLNLFEAAGIEVVFVSIPLANSTVRVIPPSVISDFQEYLKRYAAQHPNFFPGNAAALPWPDDLFVDGSHLSSPGAAIFSIKFSTCLLRWLTSPTDRTQCDLAWPG